jgi:long-chain fatty acid transport protein
MGEVPRLSEQLGMTRKLVTLPARNWIALSGESGLPDAMISGWTRIIMAALFLSLGCVASVRGSAFYLAPVEDPVLFGTADAGAAALAETPGTVFTNPAGMTRLEGVQASVNTAAVLLDLRFHNSGSATAGVFPISGNEGGNAGEPGQKVLGRLAPGLFVSMPVGKLSGKPIFFGLGVNAPFALETDYNRDSMVRYHATNTRLLTLNVNPSLAIQLAPWLSFGVGFDAEYAQVALSRAIDFGLAGFALGIPGFAPGLNDASVRLGADDMGYGWNSGLLIEPTSRTRIGLNYRSNVEFQLEGDAHFRNVAAPFNATFFNQNIKADLNLPAIFSCSAYQDIGHGFALVGDITYTEWSSFDKIQIDFSSGTTPRSVQFQSYKDVFRYSAGLIYTFPNRMLTLRAGYAYDESPIRNAELRTPRVPDSNQNIVAVGVTYRPRPAFDVNLGYAHYFLADAAINNNDGSGHLLRGTFKNSADIVSLGFTYRFGGPARSTELSADKTYRK